MTRRTASTILVATLAVMAFSSFSTPGRDTWTIDPDAAAYVELARSLADGRGYAIDGVPHAKFPPGFPLLLAAAVRIEGPEAFGLMQALVTLVWILAAALVYPIGRRVLSLGRGWSLVLFFAVATSRAWLEYATTFLRSEPLFFLLVNASLLASEMWRRRGGFGPAAAAGLLVGAATITRTAGIVLVPAVVLARMMDLAPMRLRGGRRAAIETGCFILVALGPALAFQARNASLDETVRSTGYLDELLAPYALDLTKDIDEGMRRISPLSPEMGRRIERNLAVLSLSLGKFLVNHDKGANLAVDPRSDPREPRMRPTGHALLLLLALGLLLALRRNQVVPAFAVSAYVALFLIWPFNQQERFYMPIQPLLLYLLALGSSPFFAAAAALMTRRGGRIVACVSLLAVSVLVAGGTSDHPTILGRYSLEYAGMLAFLFACLAVLAVWTVRAGSAVLPRAALARIPIAVVVGTLALWSAVSAAWLHIDQRAKWRRFVAEMEPRREALPERLRRIRTHPELIEVMRRLMERAEPDDVVMADIPKIIHAATGLHTVPARVNTATREVILRGPDGRVPRFVYVSDEIEEIYLVFQENMDRFETLYEIPIRADRPIPVRLLEVRPDHRAADPEDES